jgi:hypothetical protein
MSWIEQHADGTILTLRVVPRASRNKVDGLLGDALKIRLQAPPVEGKANKALTRFLSKSLKIPASHIQVISGETSRNKRVLLCGVAPEKVKTILL